jgi:hypothetical protein
VRKRYRKGTGKGQRKDGKRAGGTGLENGQGNRKDGQKGGQQGVKQGDR